MIRLTVAGLYWSLLLGAAIVTARAEAGEVLLEIDLADPAGGVYLPVVIARQEYLFLLDTGATATVYDASFAGLLGPALSQEPVDTPFGSDVLTLYEAIDARLGGLNLKSDFPVIATDMTMLRQVTGVDVYGIVGMTFLHRYVWDFDFDRNRLHILERFDESPEAFDVVVDMGWSDDRIPLIRARIKGADILFNVDTGDSGSGQLAAATFDVLQAAAELDIVTFDAILTVAGVTKSPLGRLRSLSLAALEYHDLIFNRGADNSLGLRFLRRHRAVLDFPGGRLLLTKGADFELADQADKSGLQLIRRGGQIVVYSVDEHGPAARAGVRAGDVVIGINNDDVGVMPLWELRQRLKAAAGIAIKLRLLRNGRPLDLEFALEQGFALAGARESITDSNP